MAQGGAVLQFRALLWKNALLQTRSRRTLFGLGGWGVLVLQVVLPAAFFLLMCIPKYYIPSTSTGQVLVSTAPALDSRWWNGPNPYSGPAMQTNDSYHAAHVILAPDTPAVRALAQVLAKALACPANKDARHCPPHVPPNNFHCLFLRPDAPPQCSDPDSCMADDACWNHLLTPNTTTTATSPLSSPHTHDTPAGIPPPLSFAADETAAVQAALRRPAWADAVVAFHPPPAAPPRASPPSTAHVAPQCARGHPAGACPPWASLSSQLGCSVDAHQADEQLRGVVYSTDLLRFTIHMNHSDVPPTRLILDAFDVSPSRNNGLALYKRYWFFANLQHTLHTCVLGMRAQEILAASPPPPAPPPAAPPTPPGPVAPPAGEVRWGVRGGAPDGPHTPSRDTTRHVLAAVTSSAWAASLEGPRPSADTRTTTATAIGSVAGSEAAVKGVEGHAGLTDLATRDVYSGAQPTRVDLAVKGFPWPAVQMDLGAASAAVFFNLLLVYAFLSPSRGIVAAMVREKELRLREGMRLMGLTETAYWGSWFLTHWSTLLASGVLCAVIGLYPFQHTALSLMLTFFALFTAALVTFSYFLSTLFSASRIAGAGAQFLYALAMLPGFLAPSVAPYAGTFWYLACLLPPGAASLWAACLINWELISQGLNWRTAALPVVQGSAFRADTVLWLLGADVALYGTLAWYLDKVLPTSPSKRSPPWFFLAPFWASVRSRHEARALLSPTSPTAPSTARSIALAGDLTASTNNATSEAEVAKDAGWGAGRLSLDIALPNEDAPGTAEGSLRARRLAAARGSRGVAVVGLRKAFSSGHTRVQALDGATLSVRPASITALLGHNGAGKTTLIAVLTGMEAADSGAACVNGLDVSTQMDAIRQDIGVCPQFDILWPELSVREHLALHAAIKGYTGPAAKQVVSDAVRAVGLSGTEAQLASELSGGQRRKLSLAAALVGNPRVVLVDEPTSGMDPATRRFTWELLRRQRVDGGSAILLTTHSMEEAEALADDVAIMAHGRVLVHGSPHELKTQFGEGYVLTLVTPETPPYPYPSPSPPHSQGLTALSVQQQGEGAGAHTPSLAVQRSGSAGHGAAGGTGVSVGGGGATSAACDAALTHVITRHVPHAVALGRQGTELAFRLPRDSTPAFPGLLRELDSLVAMSGPPTPAPSPLALGHAPSPPALPSSTPAATTTSTTRSGGSQRGALGPGSAAPSPVKGGSAALLPGVRVSSYGVSATTLEEVFLRVTEGAAQVTEGGGGTNTTPAPHTGPHTRGLTVPSASHAPDHSPGVNGGDRVGGLAASSPIPAGPWFPPDTSANPDEGTALLHSGSASTSVSDSTAVTVAAPPAWSDYTRVTGWALAGQQFRALLVKRALCAKRERLTLLTQVLAPLALVALALWSSALSLRAPSEPPVVLDRHTALLGAPTALGAAPGVRTDNGTAWDTWQRAYTAQHPAAGVDSNASALWTAGPATRATMEGYLLGTWHAGRPAYDAVFLQQLPARAAALLTGATPLQGTVLVNQSAVHAIAASIAQVADATLAFLETARPPGTTPAPPPGTFQVTNTPLPTLGMEPSVRVRQDAVGLLLVVCLTMASSLMSASVAVHLVRERSSKAKHVQLVSGAPPLLFWLSNAVWDYLQLVVTCVGILALIAAYHLPQYTGQRLAAVACLLLMFAAAGIGCTYLLQRWFTDEMVALQRLHTAYFLVGYLGFVATWVIDLILIFTQPARLRAANTWVKRGFRLVSPHFCFSKGVYDIAQTYKSDIPLPIPRETNPWAWSVWGSPMTYMAGQAVVYFLLTMVLESGWPGRAMRTVRLALTSLLPRGTHPRGPAGRRSAAGDPTGGEDAAELTTALLQGPGSRRASGAAGPGLTAGGADVAGGEDVDVAAERLAVQSGAKTAASQVWVDGLRKTYHAGPLAALRGDADPQAVRAVRGLWLGMPRGECFGLLGVNGAGKTTTFGMLTGEIRPDAGDARVGGHSVTTQLATARRMLGYCPQFESLLTAMTPREVLTLYARLRGVPPAATPGLVRELLRRLGLARAADRVCGTLSGGNKRKLALGVALVGEPGVMLLDEPSTGVDPGARRSLWGLLQDEVRRAGHTVVLTSHSMEECEALCDRVAIMVAGRAACLGSSQHLKDRFGGGYVLDVSLAPDCTPEQLVQGLQEPCPGAVIAEAHAQHAKVHVPRESAHLAALFAWLEAHTPCCDAGVEVSTNGAVAGLVLNSYTLRQATLESVFLLMSQVAAGTGAAL